VDDKIRAVLADDDEDTRRLLGVALARDGRVEVVGEATNGEIAVALVGELQPDLVLLDLGMPGGGGLEALPRLRLVAPGARVVVVSGFPGDRLAAVTRAVGAVGYVTKGLSPRRTVADVLAVADVLDVVNQAIDAAISARATFDQHVSSAGKARRFMGEKLREWDVEELLETVNLLVSELVTNAVIHAESEAEVAVVLTPDALRVEVADQGGGAAVLKDAEKFDTSGRGISLVDVLSSSWGVEPRPDGGKTIWFELETPRAP
jgi:DNA-binding NarL/FixJ family response regulator